MNHLAERWNNGKMKKMSDPKYSIVIATCKWDQAIACIDSIKECTTPEVLETIEFLVVYNGRAYLEHPEILAIRFPYMIGYPRAVNTGIRQAKGEYVILINDDCVILNYQSRNTWLDWLTEPFQDPSVGITCVNKQFSRETNAMFAIFFLVCIQRSTFVGIGLLDEVFGHGAGEDTDFCMRLMKVGFRIVKTPVDDTVEGCTGRFPVYHPGERTVHDPAIFDREEWEAHFRKNTEILRKRGAEGYYK